MSSPTSSIVIVAGALANKPGNGGEAWVRLNWILGFRALGFEVYFLEQIAPETCVDRAGLKTTFEDSLNLAYFKQVTERFGLAGRSALIYGGGERTYGLSWQALLEIAREADCLINISGHLNLKALLSRLRRTVYIDIDPGFTQIWHVTKEGGFALPDHDFYFTVGENIGLPGCLIPTGSIRWRSLRQPVVLEHWPVAPQGDPFYFTTVASWRGSYGRAALGGKTFGLRGRVAQLVRARDS